MAFQVSPGINVTEIDLSTVVPAVSTSTGAIAGVFNWGPVNDPVLITSENELIRYFGKPTAANYETWFTAANFLAYSNALYVSRAGVRDDASPQLSTFSAIAVTGGSGTSNSAHTVFNEEDYLVKELTANNDVHFVARYPGVLGNSLKISEIDAPLQFAKTIDLAGQTLGGINTSSQVPSSYEVSINVNSSTLTVAIGNSATISTANCALFLGGVKDALLTGDYITVGNSTIGTQKLKIKPGTIPAPVSVGNTVVLTIEMDEVLKLSTNFINNTPSANLSVAWEYADLVGRAPGISAFAQDRGATIVDEISIVVIDEGGAFSGQPGTVLEVFPNLSRATDAKSFDGTSLYYRDVINNTSKYVWVMNERNPATGATPDRPIASLTASTFTLLGVAKAYKGSFAGGTAGQAEGSGTLPFGSIASAYDVFRDTERYEISLLLSGKPVGTDGVQLANYLIDNVAEVRKDCVVFLSPTRQSTADAVVSFKNNLRSSSYAVLDSGYKYQYDKYNDTYRYVPLNGDIAGLAARTDEVREPWYSPAGFNRGQIKNVVKLAWNPDKTARDVLYRNGINPVVTFPGQGTVLYGDKTLLRNSSAFDRINVRRLFIVLEKAIAQAAQSTLFEFNDDFTRTQFKNLVEPFLRDVQGRRGIYDFKVVCDETNNTAEVIEQNRFVGDIYIKPAKTINFIQLNFVAVRSGVEFTEIVGQF
jgi:phage tail sheath protein FI